MFYRFHSSRNGDNSLGCHERKGFQVHKISSIKKHLEPIKQLVRKYIFYFILMPNKKMNETEAKLKELLLSDLVTHLYWKLTDFYLNNLIPVAYYSCFSSSDNRVLSSKTFGVFPQNGANFQIKYSHETTTATIVMATLRPFDKTNFIF